jgi:type I restriction enzyme, R subunit
MSNFSFLQSEWPDLFEASKKAESYVNSDPRSACFHARFALERSVIWLYSNDSYLQKPYQENLAALIHEQTFKDNLDPVLFPKILTIQKKGNFAVHSKSSPTIQEATHIIKELWHYLFWLFRSYSKWADQAGELEFKESLIPAKRTNEIPIKREELQTLLTQIEASQEKLALKDQTLQSSQTEIDELKAEIQALKKKNQAVPDNHDYNEDETRKFFIDVLLQEAGWNLSEDNVKEYEVTGMPNDTGIGFVDYVLWGNDGLPLAVVEAKRTAKSASAGKQQAKLYADCLEKEKGQRPVIFYTNGYETNIWDDTTYAPRLVQGFYKRDELQLLVDRRTSKKPLENLKIDQVISGRHYQITAINAVCESFQKKNRKALVVMATGTGKTRTLISLVDVLRNHSWVKRVLFLADRNALVRQAKNAFKAHLPDTTIIDLKEAKDDLTSRVVVSTYPTMMNAIDHTKGNQKSFSVGHFDLIVIDEAHRSVYHKYRAIFDYFDSLLIGLTATPREEADHDTYNLFELETGVPTYFYELDRAVADGYLVEGKAYSVPLKFQREGIKYNELSDQEKKEYEIKFGDPSDGDVPDEITSGALNKWLFNTDTVDKVLGNLMENGLKVQNGDRLGKTIIFAKNQKHAEFIQERFDKNYPHYKGNFARLITSHENYAQSVLDDFYKKESNPHIAVSVDMLDTGVDVPEILNLVFFKLVRSKTKFHQMIGRGTRLCPDLFGPGDDKEEFIIFDYCENFEFFAQKPNGYEGSAAEPLTCRIFKKRLTLSKDLQELTKSDDVSKDFKKGLLDLLHNQVTHLNHENFVVRPHLRQVEKYSSRSRWDGLQVLDVLEINEHIAPLPFPSDDEDIFAKRFDLTILKAQHSKLVGSSEFEGIQAQIQTIASNLESKTSIPMVQNHLDLLLELQTTEYWEHITLPMLEEARIKVRNLVRFVDKEEQVDYYTNFKDELSESTQVEIEGFSSGSSLKQYRIKVESQIKAHEDHIAIRKLKNNEKLLPLDIIELEDLLYSEEIAGTKADFLKAYPDEVDLGVFIRGLVGLDRGAAKGAFSELLDGNTFNSNQMEFINLLIDLLTQKGTMDAGQLYEPPFNKWGPDGIEAVFHRDDLIDGIIGVVAELNGNAVIEETNS